ncbi:reverse transcriptase domain-containing protein [Tanacetum coccineum]
MDQLLTESTNNVPPLVVQPSPDSTKLPPASTSYPKIPEPNPHQPSIPYLSRLNKEKLQGKDDIQIHSFLQMFKKIHFNISFSEALAHMPKFEKMVKDLLTNKEKLLEIANTPMNENCSAVILKKLPKKLGDTGRFLIPCEFYGLESCMALADLGASINLMSLSVWKTLSLPKLSTTRMTLELATRTIIVPEGIAKDVFVRVGKFTFPANFVVVDYEVDPRVPLILGRPFLRTDHALDDVHGEKLTLRVGDEELIFNVESASKHPQKHSDNSIHKIDILDTTCKDHVHEVLNFQKLINTTSGNPTLSLDPMVESLSPSLTPFGDSDCLLEETNAFLSLDDSIPPVIDDDTYDSEGDILFLESLLNDNPTPDLPFTHHPVCLINYVKKIKSSIEDPSDLVIKDLPSHLEYAFLEGTSKLPVIFAKELESEEKEHILREFTIEIHDKKGAENLEADHLSRLENPYQGDRVGMEINENFPHESLSMISLNPENKPPWFADIANYLVGNVLVKGMSSPQKKKFFKYLRTQFSRITLSHIGLVLISFISSVCRRAEAKTNSTLVS